MDRFFVDKSQIDKESKSVEIIGDDVKHISKVLRSRIGDKLEICDGENREYICEIDYIDKEVVELSIIEKVDLCRESNVRVKLYQGLPKSTKMEIILQKLTECGVDEIILVDTERSVVNINDKKEDKKLDRWNKIIYEAAKQSKRGVIPNLRGILSFDEALVDIVKNDLKYSPYEDEFGLGFKEVLRKDMDKLSLNKTDNIYVGIFIGPEGGFTPEENNKIKEKGISSVKMGPRIFRTETASIVATSIVMYELGDIGKV